MDNNKVDMFLLSNSKYFESAHLPMLREKLANLPEDKWFYISTLQFRDPITMLIISFVAGGLGVDRFLLGQTGLGVGKLLTLGGCGIWALVDLFLIMDATKQHNIKLIEPYLY